MIYIAADHRGFQLKETIKNWLAENNYQFEDLGNTVLDPEDDYVDFAGAAALATTNNKENTTKCIVICGSGVGVSIVANKVAGVRCGLGFNLEQVKKARTHDDINCLALPADFIGEEEALDIVSVFLKTEFDNEEKHRRRIEKIE